MRIQHNMTAMMAANNANRKTRTSERLASGYKINRAADNAAGLTISENMRAQIRGINRANNNAEDGISLIQTAEGGMEEISQILQRVRELSVQAGNDTNTTADRSAIQEEIDSLLKEVDKIATSTEFNQKKVLNGDYSTPIGINSKPIGDFSGGIDFGNIKKTNTITVDGQVFEFVNNSTPLIPGATPIDLDGLNSANDVAAEFLSVVQNTLGAGYEVNLDAASLVNDKDISINKIPKVDGQVVNVSFGTSIPEVISHVPVRVTDYPGGGGWPDEREFFINQIDSTKIIDGSTLEINGILFEYDDDGSSYNPSATRIDISGGFTPSAYQNALAAAGFTNDIFITTGHANGSLLPGSSIMITDTDTSIGDSLLSFQFNPPGTLPKMPGKSNFIPKPIDSSPIRLQVGANAGQEVSFFIESVKTNKLGLQDISVMDHDLASDSITRVDKAINKVSENRGVLGSIQNRLEHVLNQNQGYEENLQNAESKIRDTDFAEDMMIHTKENIIQQSAQSVLVNSTKNPERILDLLKN